MEKIIIVCILGLFLTGCGQTITPIKEVCQKEFVPIVTVPAPPVVPVPTLPIDTLTPAQLSNDGLVVKYSTATIKALEDYVSQLQAVIADYQKKHDAAIVIQNQIENAGTIPTKQ